MEQVVVETRSGLWDSTVGRRGESGTRNDHPVVSLIDRRRARDKSGIGIDRYGLGWVVKPRIEQNHVCPLGMVGNNDRITNTIIDC